MLSNTLYKEITDLLGPSPNDRFYLHAAEEHRLVALQIQVNLDCYAGDLKKWKRTTDQDFQQELLYEIAEIEREVIRLTVTYLEEEGKTYTPAAAKTVTTLLQNIRNRVLA